MKARKLETVYIYIYIERFNKIKENRYSFNKKAIYFRRI